MAKDQGKYISDGEDITIDRILAVLADAKNMPAVKKMSPKVDWNALADLEPENGVFVNTLLGKYSEDQPRDEQGRFGSGGGGRSTGAQNGKIPYEPLRGNVMLAEQATDRDISRFAKYHDASSKSIEQQCMGNLDSLLENDLAIRRGVRGAEGFLTDERMKTQFETGTSGGTMDTASRLRAEFNGLGAEAGIPVEQRPVYGYARTDEHEASMYGPVEFVLNDSVKDRTTITVGDSLNGFSNERQVGTPWRNPGKGSIDAKTSLLFEAKSNRISAEYIEAQIHGGVRLKDVAKIRLHARPIDVDRKYAKEYARVIELAGEKGIPVEWTRSAY